MSASINVCMALIAGGEAKLQLDVESGLNESFTSAASKLDAGAGDLSPFLTSPTPEEVLGC